LNSQRKKLFCLFTAAAMLGMCAMPAFSQQPVQKDEVVYANLGHNGWLDNIYVVNSFELKAGQT
jgi:putative membrane protein